MKAVKFPYLPAAAAVISDEDGHTVAIFFPQLFDVSDGDEREAVEAFLVQLLESNHITAQSVKREVLDVKRT